MEIFWKLCHPAIERARLHFLVELLAHVCLLLWQVHALSAFPEQETIKLFLLTTSLLLLPQLLLA